MHAYKKLKLDQDEKAKGTHATKETQEWVPIIPQSTKRGMS